MAEITQLDSDLAHGAACAHPGVQELCLLGQPRLLRAGAAPHVLERRDAALLAALVLQGPMPRDRATAWLWPLADRKAGQNNLRQRLFRLKQLAGAELVSTGAVLHLADGVQHDIGRFAEGVAAGQASADELLGTLDYRDCGELGDWVEHARQQWQRRRNRLWMQAAETADREMRWHDGLACVRLVLGSEPAAEHAHRLHMRLHYVMGNRAAALAAWADCQRALHEELGVEPEAETADLASLITRSGPPPATAAQRQLQQPAALLRPPVMVGRDGAWRVLQQATASGQCVVLTAEPGMGKTRLLTDWVRHLGAAGVCAAALRADRLQPLALMQRVLLAVQSAGRTLPARDADDLLPQAGSEPLGASAQWQRQAWIRALAGWHAQGVAALVLDDLQWADDATLLLLSHALEEAGTQKPILVLAWRTAEAPLRLLGVLQDAATCLLRLAPLSPHESRLFVESLALPGMDAATWAARLDRHTGGNPGLMLQLLAARQVAPDDWPPTVTAAAARQLDERMALLSRPALRLLRVLALAEVAGGAEAPAGVAGVVSLQSPAGAAAQLSLAAEVLSVKPIDLADACQELQRAHLLREGAFAHGLWAGRARQSVPEPVAALLHADLAAALQRRGAAAAVVAEHWALAGHWSAAADCLHQAAVQARLRSARSEALTLHERAADAHQRAAQPAAAWQQQLLALALAHAIEPGEALAQRADALLQAANRDEDRLAALLHRCRIWLSASDAQGALAPSQEALQLAQRLGPSGAWLTAVAWQGLALTLLGHGDEGQQLFGSALLAARAEPDKRAQLDFYGSHGYALHVLGRYRDAMVPLRLAAQMARELGELGDCFEQLNNLAVCCSSAGDRAAELQTVEQVLQLWRQMGQPAGLMADTALVQVASAFIADGRYSECLDLLPALLERLTREAAPHWAVIAAHRLAHLYMRLGQPARSRQCLRPLPPDASVGAQLARVLVLARLDHLKGQTPVADLQQAQQRWSTELQTLDRHNLLLMLAELSPDEEAIALCNALLAEPDPAGVADQGPGFAPVRRHARLRRALRLCLQGQVAEALADARTAWAELQVGPAQGLETAEACRLVAWVARAAHDPLLARDALQTGMVWIERVRHHVPPPFLDSFLHRNPAVSGLMRMAREV